LSEVTELKMSTQHYFMEDLFLKVLGKQNLKNAYRKVVGNKGAGGVDKLEVSDLKPFLTKNWKILKEQVKNGKFLPQPILGVEIPKPNGKKRLLGIPTVFDRMLQQAVCQVLVPIFEPLFSDNSFGFRPKRNAGQAVLKAQQFINQGYTHIVDIDLKQFFDLVNHDFLMTLIYRKVKNPLLLSLILKFLQAPIEISGQLRRRRKGVPQGSPLSPLLSNIILNELDKELELRGLRFVRYADDFSIFVGSSFSAKRVMMSVNQFIERKLHLKINQEKSSVVRPLNYEFLGYAFAKSYRKGSRGSYNLAVSNNSFKELKRKIKLITKKTRPVSFSKRIQRLKPLMFGWLNYFGHASMSLKLKRLDSWVRSRLRYCIWHDWKKPNKRKRSLIRLGVKPGIAYAHSRSRMGGWAVARSPILRTTITLRRLKQRFYISFLEYYRKIRR
jgi:group II intron reverse transcriptase/maturase